MVGNAWLIARVDVSACVGGRIVHIDECVN